MTTTVTETSADVIAAFMQQMIVEYQTYDGAPRRREPRESVAVPVTVQPCDADFEPCGSSLNAVTRDLSLGGIAIFHTQPIDAPYVQITLTAPSTHSKMNLLGKIEHQTPCGGFTIIGCRFTSDQASPESH